jgi:hypothetical protein
MTSKPDRRARQRGEAGIGRPGGLLVMVVMAALTFLVGRAIVGPRAPEAPVAPPVAVVDAGHRAMADALAADAAAMDAQASDGAAIADAAAAAVDASAGAKGAELAPPAPKATEPAPKTAEPAPAEPSAPAHKAAAAADNKDKEDKDTAHEAWRANAPSITTSGTKSVMIVPLKGSSEDASYKLVRKSKAVIITLPHAASMITMKLYNLKKDGFKQLWVYQQEVNAKASDGSALKVVFTEPVDPVVDIKDDYVRVTIRHPEAAAAPAASDTPTPDNPSPSRDE